MASQEIASSSALKETDGGRQRFLLELEFVQCLANPTYIHYLAQNRHFEDEAFVNYLKYLQYWRRPEYAKFIMYPHCLFFLELLQSSQFRVAMVHPGSKEVAHRQQFYFWKNYRTNRLKHILPRPMPEVPPPAPPAAAAATAAAAAAVPTPAAGSNPPQLPQAPVAGKPEGSRSSSGERRKRKYTS